MTTIRKTMLGLFVALFVALLAPLAIVSALAGPAAAAGPVQVFATWAQGDMGNAHNTAGSQYIGCLVSTDTVGPPLLYCEANDGAGNVNFCVSTNVNMLNTAQTIQVSSGYEFGWDGSHGCTFFVVLNYSQPPGRKNP
jgi:hypothetical protein